MKTRGYLLEAPEATVETAKQYLEASLRKEKTYWKKTKRFFKNVPAQVRTRSHQPSSTVHEQYRKSPKQS